MKHINVFTRVRRPAMLPVDTNPQPQYMSWPCITPDSMLLIPFSLHDQDNYVIYNSYKKLIVPIELAENKYPHICPDKLINISIYNFEVIALIFNYL